MRVAVNSRRARTTLQGAREHAILVMITFAIGGQMALGESHVYYDDVPRALWVNCVPASRQLLRQSSQLRRMKSPNTNHL